MQIKQRIQVRIDGDFHEAELRSGKFCVREGTARVIRDTVEIHVVAEPGSPPAILIADDLRAFLAAVDAVR